MKTLTYSRINNRGKLVEFIYSECDSELIDNHIWRLTKGYATTLIKLGEGKYQSKKLHRLLMGDPENLQVDHINGNKADNRRENLRVCTSQENTMNQKLQHNNKSGYKGVFWHKTKLRWCVSITYKNKRYYLGEFKDKDKAILARKEAEEKYYKEFRRK